MLSRAGMIQSLSVHYRYRNQPICIHTVIMLYWYRWLWRPQKNDDYCGTKTNTLWIKLWYTLHRWSFCFSASICWNHCIDQPTTFTLLLKSKILDFETLSHVHVYRNEYVSYQQGLYRICILSAADHIVQALILSNKFCRIGAKIYISTEHLKWRLMLRQMRERTLR